VPLFFSAVFYIQVALRDLPEASERLRAIYAPVTLFVVFSSVLMHGVTVPVSKLGPGLLRHTTTLTKTRSITFTSRPGSRTQTMTGEEEKNNGERVPWNPLLSLWEGLLHVVLFWRKDSFWRRPPKSTPEGIKGLTISGPRDGHAQSIIEPKSGEGEERTPSNTSDDTTDSEGGPKGARLPPAPLELPTTHGSNGHATSQRPQTPTAAHPQASRIGHLVREFEHALNHELSAERQEAQEEAAEGWSAEIKAAMRAQKAVEEAEKAGGGGGGGTGPSTPLRNTANQGILENRSAPGTPGQRSIRFGGATSEDLLKTAVSRMRDREADQ
jgi:sodium/hydrogen antiporter